MLKLLKISKNKTDDSFLDKMEEINDEVKNMNNKSSSIINAIDKYGAENIFFLYSSPYDSYYYNNITGEIFHCDSSRKFHDILHINTALEEDYVDKEILYKKVYKDEKDNIDKLYFTDSYIKKLFNIAKVEVNRGRKWKGTGYIVGETKSSYQYSPWNSSTTYLYRIYDPKTNTIYEINQNYADFKDVKDKFEEYKKYLLDLLNKTKEKDIIYEMSNHKFVFFSYINKFKEFDEWMKEKYDPKIDLSKARDIEQEKQDKKNDEFKAKKMPELIEWVKTHTDKKGDEIEKLAEHIFNKRYGNRD